MKFEIKSWFDGRIIFEGEFGSMKLCVEAAFKSRASLSGANLSRADLSGADLSGASLSGAYLSGADLSGAYLSGAYLSRANLSRANLSGASLSGADLSRANLSRANLSGASLSGADLSRADLSGAYLSGADLSGASLSGANLSGADLSGAYLSRANLSGANLSGAYLSDLKNGDVALAQMRITPQEGAFVGWKKLRGDVIAKLVIPHDAARVNCFGSRKCRAEKVFVHALYRADGTPLDENAIAYDRHTGKTAYQEGSTVLPDSFDPSITVECSHGIHFFITREEAASY